MKVIIIGCSGHWGYTLNGLKQLTVAGIAPGFSGEDMLPVKKALAENGIDAPIYNNVDQLLSLQPDIAVINTRFDLNSAYTLRCLSQNIYVFSEKPLATDINELKKIESAKTTAFVSAMFGISYQGWCLTVKEAVKSIGNIRMINCRKSYKLGKRPDFYKNKATFGGMIPWVAIHALHWIYFTTGLKFESVSAMASSKDNFDNGQLDTCAVASFNMENGAFATVTADYYRPFAAPTWDDDRIRIVGTKGIVEYENGTVTLLNEAGKVQLPILPDQDIFDCFIRRIHGENIGISPEESVYITRVALLAQQCADEKINFFSIS